MKILKIVLLSFLGLALVSLAAVLVFIKTFDGNRYKPQIVGAVKSVIDRDVDFARAGLDISWDLDISFKISDLAVSENGTFGGGDFLHIKEISVSLDIPAFIFKKQLLVSAVNIMGPRLTIIRNKDGAVNAATLLKPPPQNAGTDAGAGIPAAGAALAFPLSVSALNIYDGTIVYLDKSFQPPLSVSVEGLEFKASGVSLDGAFPFTVKAGVLSARKNLRLQGKAAVDPARGEVCISDTEGRTDLSELDMQRAAALLPADLRAFLPAGLKGKVDITLSRMTAGAKGLSALELELGLNDGEAGIKDLVLPLENISASLSVTETDIKLKNLSAAAGGGRINASGGLNDYTAGGVFNVNAAISGVKLQKFLAQEKMPVKMEGEVTGKIILDGKGFSPDETLSGLSGEADIVVQQPALKDINILRAALDKITVLPFLTERVIDAMPDKYRERFNSKDTMLKRIELPVKLSGGKASAENTLVAGDDFVLAGKTEAGMDGSFALEGQLEISEELSALMTKAVKELEYLFNKDKQIILPLKLSGKAGSAKVEVDPGYIADRLLSGGIGTQLIGAVGKALDKGDVSSGADGDKSGSVTDLVNSVIDSLLQKK